MGNVSSTNIIQELQFSITAELLLTDSNEVFVSSYCQTTKTFLRVIFWERLPETYYAFEFLGEKNSLCFYEMAITLAHETHF